MTKLQDALMSFNPWWVKSYAALYKEREVYAEIQRYLKMPMMIALSGLRRVGKTTIMLKIVEDYIRSGLDPSRVLFFSFDEFRDAQLLELIKEYENLHGLNIREGKYLFLFDEIQKLDDWQNKIKTIYDLYKDRIKIVVSGSESLFIKKYTKENLAGRIFEFHVNPLSFKEFIFFKGQQNVVERPRLYERERLRLFEEYMHIQGFPELVGIDDKEAVRKYIREGIVDKVIYKDIPQLFKIENPSALESLINIFMDEPGQLLELSELAAELTLTRQTISNYLFYLEESQLLKKLYNYSRNRRKSERKLKKYYPTIASVDLLYSKDETSRSRAFEWLVINRLSAEFFWRDSYKNEVDMVFGKERPMPIEIKFGKISVAGIGAFMRKFGVSKGTIVSYDKEDELTIEEGRVSVVPAHRLLLEQFQSK